jgi:hypothetical protein
VDRDDMLFGLDLRMLNLLDAAHCEAQKTREDHVYEKAAFRLQQLPTDEALKLLWSEKGVDQVRLAASLGLLIAHSNGILVILTEPMEWMWSTIESFLRFYEVKQKHLPEDSGNATMASCISLEDLVPLKHEESELNVGWEMAENKSESSSLFEVDHSQEEQALSHAELAQWNHVVKPSEVRRTVPCRDDQASLSSASSFELVDDE